MLPEALTNIKSPPFVACIGSPSDLTDLLWQGELSHDGLVARQIRGKKSTTVHRLFDELSAAFQFPYYFGENWDALDECICDLDWLPATAYIMSILDAEYLLVDAAEDDLTVFVRMLDRVSKEWATSVNEGEAWDRSGLPFKIILHTETPHQIAPHFDRLLQLGSPLTRIELSE